MKFQTQRQGCKFVVLALADAARFAANLIQRSKHDPDPIEDKYDYINVARVMGKAADLPDSWWQALGEVPDGTAGLWRVLDAVRAEAGK